jgi:peptide/nickel transport system ATP-binding protein
VSAILLRIEALTIVPAADRSRPIVHCLSLRLHRGEILGLIGESGAGKSTIGLAALGYVRPGCLMTEGSIQFEGQELRGISPRQLVAYRGRRAAYVAQSAAAAFNPAKRLYAQICEGPVRHALMSFTAAKSHAVQLLRELDLPFPETFGDRYPHQASGGQLQRAMTAMAMSCRPDILVFDEPTTALDVTTQVEVLASIRKLVRDHGVAALYISHDLPVVAQMADRIMVLRHGKTIEEGAATQILHHPRMDYTRALVSLRQMDREEQPVVAGAEPPLLQLEGVTAGYARRRSVVHDIDLLVRRGETVGLVGESGSGKSSLARIITGLLPPSAGAVRFQGAALPRSLGARKRDVLRRVQMVYQIPDIALNPRQRIGEILGRPLRLYFGMTGKRLRERIAALLADTDLSADLVSRYPAQLSGGQKQRICIARALAADPDLIICDEITSALDPLVARGVLDLLRKLQRERGYAYLFITHDLDTVRRIAHRVAVMLEGRIIAEGSYAAVFSPPLHPYADRLLSSVPQLDVRWLDTVLARRPDAEVRQTAATFAPSSPGVSQ